VGLVSLPVAKNHNQSIKAKRVNRPKRFDLRACGNAKKPHIHGEFRGEKPVAPASIIQKKPGSRFQVPGSGVVSPLAVFPPLLVVLVSRLALFVDRPEYRNHNVSGEIKPDYSVRDPVSVLRYSLGRISGRSVRYGY